MSDILSAEQVLSLVERGQRDFKHGNPELEVVAVSHEQLRGERDRDRQLLQDKCNELLEAVFQKVEAEEERDRLHEAIEEYGLWRPCEKGHAAAHHRLMAALHPEGEEKCWCGEPKGHADDHELGRK